MRTPISITLLAFGLAACSPTTPDGDRDIIVGGPCAYETTIIEATVTGVEEDGATFSGPDGEFRVSAEYLGTLPAVGDTLTLKRELITKGTCTPEIYSVVPPDSQ